MDTCMSFVIGGNSIIFFSKSRKRWNIKESVVSFEPCDLYAGLHLRSGMSDLQCRTCMGKCVERPEHRWCSDGGLYHRVTQGYNPALSTPFTHCVTGHVAEKFQIWRHSQPSRNPFVGRKRAQESTTVTNSLIEDGEALTTVCDSWMLETGSSYKTL